MSYNPFQGKTENDSQREEDYDHLLPQEESLSRKPPRSIPRWVFIAGSPVICLFLIGFGAWIGSHSSYNFNAKCLEHVQNWSPIQRDVNNNYHEVLFNGSFMKQNVFRQEACPEVDAAWDSLGINYRGIRLPVEDAKRTGLSPSQESGTQDADDAEEQKYQNFWDFEKRCKGEEVVPGDFLMPPRNRDDVLDEIP
ncbi:uncharacterized protein PAC_09142 [Phialocephala subalpina]|uniref:Uncharacterized protein n=1 Tax=Phialocephala subalpina TaxID=576137 RepID=A0A1L7X2K4_9HELO|nr:uncharacterized protein PAC_09142 [Phialocephala subalpina]